MLFPILLTALLSTLTLTLATSGPSTIPSTPPSSSICSTNSYTAKSLTLELLRLHDAGNAHIVTNIDPTLTLTSTLASNTTTATMHQSSTDAGASAGILTSNTTAPSFHSPSPSTSASSSKPGSMKGDASTTDLSRNLMMLAGVVLLGVAVVV